MANTVTNRTVNIYIESGQAQKALDALIAREDKLKKALAEATDPAKLKDLQEQLEQLATPLDAAKIASQNAKKAVSNLVDEQKKLTTALKGTDDAVKTDKLRTELAKVKDSLAAARNESRAANSELQKLTRQQSGLKESIAKAMDPKQVERLKNELAALEEPIDRARKKLSGELEPSLRDIRATAEKLKREFSFMSEGDNGWDKMKEQVDRANGALVEQKEKMGLLGQAVKSFWEEAKTVAVGVIIGNTVESALETTMGYITGMVTGSAKIADEMADIEKTTGLSTEQVTRLNKELSRIDTRTSAADLRGLAQEAGKLGKDSVESVAKFVDEADKINVALGEDLGEGAITTLGKLSKIFKVEMLNIGSAINEVGASSEASESFAVEFLNRLAGTGPAVKLSADELLGYGAALEVAGQTAEVSGTALSGFFIDFTKDTEKFGTTAGMARGELTKLLNEKGTNAAFLEFLTRLKEANPEAKDFLTKMGQLGVDGSRGANVLLALSNNIEGVRKQQEIANGAIQSNASIMNEFSKKNNNAAADLDKLRKNFAGLFASDTIREGGAAAVRMLNDLVNALKGIPRFISDNKAALISMAGAYLLLRANVLLAYGAKAVDLILTKQQIIYTELAVAKDLLHAYWIDYKTKKITLATLAQKAWNTVTALGPGIIGAMVVAIGLLVYAITKAVTKTQELTNVEKINADLKAKVAESTSDAIEKMRQLTEVATSNNLSLDARRDALKQLIAIAPEYLNGLTLENITTKEGTELMGKYVEKLKEKALAEAQAGALSDAQRVKESSFAKIRAGFQAKTGQVYNDEQIEKYVRQAQSIDTKNTVAGIRFSKAEAFGLDLRDVVESLDVIKDLQAKVDENNRNAAQSAIDAAKAADAKTDAQRKATIDSLNSIEALEAKLKQLQEDRDKTTNNKTRDNLNRDIKTVEDRIAAMRGKAQKLSKEAKQSAKDFKDLQEELRKMQLDLMGDGFVKDLAELEDKFAKLREKAHGNNKLLLQVEELYQRELANLRVKYFDLAMKAGRDRDAAQKAEDERKFKERMDRLAVYAQRSQEAMALSVQTNRDNRVAGLDLAAQRAFLVKRRDLQKQSLQLEENEEIAALKKKYNIKEGEEHRIQNMIDQVQEKYRKKRLDADLEMINTFLNFAQQAFSVFNNIAQARTEKENADLERDRRNNEKKKANLDKRLKAGHMSQLQYDREVQKIEKSQEKREREIRLKQFKRDQRASMAQALINGGLAVTETLAKFGPPVPPNIMGIVAMAFTAASIATQVAAISSRKPPEYARGGFLSGPSHSDPSRGMPVTDPYTGRVHAYVEGGEAILNKRTMADQRTYTLTGTPSQIGSALNGLGGGVEWASGAVLKAKWMTVPQPSMNVGAISSAIGSVRMYAAGGTFAAPAAAAGGSTTATAKDETNQQMLATLAFLGNTVLELKEQMKQPIKSYTVLRDLEEQQDRMAAIRAEGTMR